MKTFSYIPHTADDKKRMMDFLGISDVSELFSDIPTQVRMTGPLQLPKELSELELERHMARLAGKNLHLQNAISFLGAGSYEHYQPSVVDAIISRSEFYTSYTPYQPEISQGMLQAIFEYQTMAAELTGMDLANASMYDGPSAFAEAAIVTAAHTRRNRLLTSRTVHPEYRAVMNTYASGQSIQVDEIPYKDGVIDLALLEAALDDTVAGVLVQYPNFFGNIEDLAAIAELAHRHGALLVVAAYPIALGLLEAPGNLGADVVVAEGQSLGNAMAFGGPYLGIMAAKKELMRRVPGRIVGQTKDSEGRRGFVLTLQAREQHIRREKATSNICSNQALNALAATVYLSYLGPEGLREVASQNFHKAHYLKGKLEGLGLHPVFQSSFFNEFVVQVGNSLDKLQETLLQNGYLFGLSVEKFYPELQGCVLLNVTEMRTKEELDRVCELVEGTL